VVDTIPAVLAHAADTWPDAIALFDDASEPITFA